METHDRYEVIFQLAKFFNVGFLAAQDKYYSLKKKGNLDRIMAMINDGEAYAPSEIKRKTSISKTFVEHIGGIHEAKYWLDRVIKEKQV